MSLPAEEHQIGSLDLKAVVGLALTCQVRTGWIQAGGSDLGCGTEAAGEDWSRLLHCSLTQRKRNGIEM